MNHTTFRLSVKYRLSSGLQFLKIFQLPKQVRWNFLNPGIAQLFTRHVHRYLFHHDITSYETEH